MAAEIDHTCTSEVVCPHCGHVHSDSWEFEDDGEMECWNCDKPFRFTRYTDVTYNTSKVVKKSERSRGETT